MNPDVEFFFDPVCPFCWVTSQWVRTVRAQRDLAVRWRFISLRLLNDGDYADKPDGYPDAHDRGRQMLRVAAAARDQHGEQVVGPLYEAMGEAVWGGQPLREDSFDALLEHTARAGDLKEILDGLDLPTDLARVADDPAWDGVLADETEEALQRVGGDIGTPVLSFDPPDGPAFFGPVISEVPGSQDALRLWEAVETLARWPGFSELKRSLRWFPVTPTTAPLAGRQTQAS